MMDGFDHDVADPSAQDPVGLTYPMVIWRNGDPAMKKLGPGVSLDGGFFFPLDSAGHETKIPEWTLDSFIGDRDMTVEGLYAKAADIIVVRIRRRWQGVDEFGNRVFMPWNRYDRNLRLKGRMHAVGFIHGFPDPVVFSFSGNCMKDFEAAHGEFYKKVIAGIVNKDAPAGKGLPGYACYMRVIAGPPRRARADDSQSKFITPPKFHAPPKIDREYALGKYIGREMLINAQNLYHSLDAWAHEWDQFDDALAAPAPIEELDEALPEAPSRSSRAASRPPSMTKARDIDEIDMPSADEIFNEGPVGNPPEGY